MFVRVKKNRSGSSSVLVVRKASGRYIVVKNLGVATDAEAIESLRKKGEEWIRLHTNPLPMQFGFDEREEARRVLDNIDFIYHDGARIILNQVYHLIGFDEIKDSILRDLVVARICEPASKRSTLEYLKDYFDEDYTLNKVYYYLDKLGSKQKNTVRRISVEHTRKILGGKIGLMFYDCTSLYFETSNEDKLRAKGFSKDGKTAESQIILGLLVSEDGYPLHYCIHRGDRHEGRTMIPAVNRFMKIFKLDKKDFIIVADAGLMSKDNVKLLKENGYSYIIGARIKSETAKVKDWILTLEKKPGTYKEYTKDTGDRLIIGYSEARAKNDEYNRERGLKKLRKKFASGKLTKDSVNKHGYNRLLVLSGTDNVTVEISEKLIEEDKRWDGLKGYVTNTDIGASLVVDQYHGLSTVERSFRVTKGTLEMRPMFHFTPKRIGAHICMCFVALKVYKELERICQEKEIGMSVDSVIKVAKTIVTIRVNLPNLGEKYLKTIFTTEKQRMLEPLFHLTDYPQTDGIITTL